MLVASGDARPFLEGVGHLDDQGVEPRSTQHAETDADLTEKKCGKRARTHASHTGPDQVSSAEGATRSARERHKPYRRTGPD